MSTATYNVAKNGTTQEKVNILMVDDQPSKLLSYEAMLAETGENLLKASSGKEALEILLKSDVAVVLMDVSMPEIDGFELANLIRQHPRFEKVAIIFVSAVHLSDMDRIRGYQRGAVDYIGVPIIPEILRAKVGVFAELHRKARQLERLNGDLRQLSNALLTAQDEERRRIARQLHEGLGQDITAARIMLGAFVQPRQTEENRARVVAEACTLVDRAIQQVRTMSHILHPPMLDEVGLLSALRWYLEGFTSRSGIQAELEVSPEEFPRLAFEVETAVFRIIQEALTNVFRHAGATRVVLALKKRDNDVLVTVQDNGRGVQPQVSELQPAAVGVGIIGMKQRVQELGGRLSLENANPGLLVEAVIPVSSSLATASAFAES